MGQCFHRYFKQVLGVLLLLFVSFESANAGSISLNFRDTDIRVIIESVAKIAHKNIIIDPRVRATVTIISEDTLDDSNLYDALLFILSLYGYTAVNGKYAIVIVPMDASSSVVPDIKGNREPLPHDTITQILTINNVPAASMAQVLQPFFAGSTTRTFVVPNSNRLIISGPKNSIDYARSIIDQVDRVSASDYDLIPLKYASSNEALALLRTIFISEGSNLKLQADSRTNRIIIVSQSRETRMAVRAVLADIDAPVRTGQQGNLRVFYLRYAKSEDLAPTLTSLLSSRAFENVNPEDAAGSGASNNSGNAPAAPPPPPPSSGSGSGGSEKNFSIVADKALNSIVVVGDTRVIKSVQSLIEQLDIPRRQVAIEFVVAEISDQLNHKLGTDLVTKSNTGGLVASNMTGTLSKTISTITTSGGNNLAGAALDAVGAGGSGIGAAKVGGNGDLKWGALITAINSDTKSRVLSTPFITVMDNQESSLNVGEERPFVTGSYTQTGSSSSISSPFQTIERKNVGIEIHVKPQINSGKTISMEVKERVSSVKDDVSASSDNVITSVREMQTSIIAEDGDIVAMGGLMENNAQDTNRKIPILGSIPLIGRLFSYEGKESNHRTLVVFIRPTIMSTTPQIQDFSREKYEGLARNLSESTGRTLEELRNYFGKPEGALSQKDGGAMVDKLQGELDRQKRKDSPENEILNDAFFNQVRPRGGSPSGTPEAVVSPPVVEPKPQPVLEPQPVKPQSADSSVTPTPQMPNLQTTILSIPPKTQASTPESVKPEAERAVNTESATPPEKVTKPAPSNANPPKTPAVSPPPQPSAPARAPSMAPSALPKMQPLDDASSSFDAPPSPSSPSLGFVIDNATPEAPQAL